MWVLYLVRYTLMFDGACEPINPGGTASYGLVILREGVLLLEDSRIVGQGEGITNNVAEYLGLIRGLEEIAKYAERGDEVEIRGDSQLVIRQMTGKYAVRAKRIIPLYQRAVSHVKALQAKGVHVFFKWVTREQNTQADRLSHRH